MRRLDRNFVDQRIEYILTRANQTRPPVDLVALARIQRVRIIEFRPMILDGCIDVIAGGFNIFLRGDSFQSWNVDEDIEWARLKPRQRFTLAHEIVHTFFYDLSGELPVVSKRAPKVSIIEHLCQYGAGQMLLPERLLTPFFDLNKFLDHKLTVKLARGFGTSSEVVIRRVNRIERFKNPDWALILAKTDRSGQDAKIRAACYSSSLLPYFPKPTLFSSLRESYTNILGEDFWGRTTWEREIKLHAGSLVIRKRPHSAQGRSFFLEIEFLPKMKTSR